MGKYLNVVILGILVTLINSLSMFSQKYESVFDSCFNNIPNSNVKMSTSLRFQNKDILQNDYYTISIHNQEDFNNLNSSLTQVLSQGIRNIRLRFERGQYEYNENQIQLSNLDSTYNIIIDGNQSEIISKSSPVGKTKSPYYIYSNNNGPIDQWSQTIQAEEAILPTEEDNIYKLKLNQDVNIEAGDLIKVSQWFLSSIYEVKKVEDEYVYFSSDYPYKLNRQNWDNTWNMNHDVRYGNVMPRFRIFKSSNIANLDEHHSICFLDIKNSNFNSLIITNLNIWGSAYNIQTGIINLVNTTSKHIVIENCNFHDCKSQCIRLIGVKNVLIKGCKFTNNYNTCIKTDDECINTCIVGNYFEGNGRDWYNYFDIIVSGENFIVADNTLINFTYGAIRVGNWWGLPKKGLVTGIVENNLIYYTPDFLDNFQKYTLMDSGAIYVSTINDDVHIRYNRIYNIAGMKNYRGIFGDDGTCNSKIYGNIITEIKDSNCIEVWYAPEVEKKEQYKFGKVNVGNILIYNFVDGDIKFEGRTGNNNCIKGMNFLLDTNGHKSPNIQTKNIINSERDTIIHSSGVTDEFIVLSSQSYNQLNKSPIYTHIEKWIQVHD